VLYISAKEPYVSTKEPYISRQRAVGLKAKENCRVHRTRGRPFLKRALDLRCSSTFPAKMPDISEQKRPGGSTRHKIDEFLRRTQYLAKEPCIPQQKSRTSQRKRDLEGPQEKS